MVEDEQIAKRTPLGNVPFLYRSWNGGSGRLKKASVSGAALRVARATIGPCGAQGNFNRDNASHAGFPLAKVFRWFYRFELKAVSISSIAHR
jgi:hypothetical protein